MGRGRGGDVRARENLLMHLGAIDASTLLKEQREALALRIGFVEIFAQVFECIPHPAGLVQAIIAQLCACGRQGQQQSRRKCD